MPWDGINAVDGARKVLERLDRLNLGAEHCRSGQSDVDGDADQKRAGHQSHRSGHMPNHTRPAACCRATIRTPHCDDIQDAVADLPPWSVEVTRGAFMYPSEVGADCAVAAAVRRAGRALKGQDGEVFYSPAALDAGYLNQRGIETIMFGPGDLRFAHTDQEVVSVQEVRDAVRIYAATALELLA